MVGGIVGGSLAIKSQGVSLQKEKEHTQALTREIGSFEKALNWNRQTGGDLNPLKTNVQNQLVKIKKSKPKGIKSPQYQQDLSQQLESILTQIQDIQDQRLAQSEAQSLRSPGERVSEAVAKIESKKVTPPSLGSSKGAFEVPTSVSVKKVIASIEDKISQSKAKDQDVLLRTPSQDSILSAASYASGCTTWLTTPSQGSPVSSEVFSSSSPVSSVLSGRYSPDLGVSLSESPVSSVFLEAARKAGAVTPKPGSLPPASKDPIPELPLKTDSLEAPASKRQAPEVFENKKPLGPGVTFTKKSEESSYFGCCINAVGTVVQSQITAVESVLSYTAKPLVNSFTNLASTTFSFF